MTLDYARRNICYERLNLSSYFLKGFSDTMSLGNSR
jgi:hypothetical protein